MLEKYGIDAETTRRLVRDGIVNPTTLRNIGIRADYYRKVSGEARGTKHRVKCQLAQEHKISPKRVERIITGAQK